MLNQVISKSSTYLLQHTNNTPNWYLWGKTMLRKIPHLPGIYQIKCISNGKIYIGSAIDMHERCEHHRSSLRRKNHRNAHLQAAWNKHGEENFEFAVLELTESSNLLQLEQNWLDQTQSFNREIGFNIYSLATSPGEANARVWEGFIDPNGNEVTIKNLYDFCRQNGLDFPSMHRLARGKSKLRSYKSWSHENSPRQREYTKTYDGFIAPMETPWDQSQISQHSVAKAIWTTPIW